MTARSLQLPLTMPPGSDHWHTCARCIEERLSSRPGVRRVRVIAGDGSRPDAAGGFLELDYDPDVVSLTQINGYLRTAGSCFSPSISHLVLPVEGLDSPRQEQVLRAAIDALPGVRSTVSYTSQTIRLEFDRNQCQLPQIVRLLDDHGVTLRPLPGAPGSGGHDEAPARLHPPEAPAATVSLPQPNWVRAALSAHDMVLAVLAGVFLLAGFLVHLADGPQQLRIALLLVSYVCGGLFPAQDMVRTLTRFQLDIDLLMFAAAFGAAALGHYEEGAMLLFLFSLGGAGERLAMDRARRAIKALASLAPRTAQRVEADGSHREVPVEELRIGDEVFVAPGQQIPADGQVTSGASAVNQAPITGESVPVDKAPGSDAFAGTINGDGALTLRVGKLAADNTLSKVIRLVAEAQTTKSPTQVFTDRVEKWYVPLVILATVCLVVLPPLLGWAHHREHPSLWAGWFYQAMAFLTAASPCALAIGTPAAVLSGIARAARGGVLIKGGIHLENLGRVTAIAFDKTGTLTYGKPEVTDVVPLAPDLSDGDLLALAAAVERGSQHPLAQSIVTAATARGGLPAMAQNIEQTPGMGIRGQIGGRRIAIGRASMFAHLPGAPGVADRVAALEDQGRTTVVVADDQGVLGVIGLADRPRPGVREMLAQLRNLGIKHIIMLTGDNRRTAAAVAQQVGLDEYLADLMPEDKLAKVRELDRKFGRVAMVGDGVNDAPAMANATIGIAIGGGNSAPASGDGAVASADSGAGGGSASDVALETADIALLGQHLSKLPEGIGVSRFARRIIIQNLVIALGVILVVAPLAALGRTPISLAVLLHEGSTVVVVLNSLRILAYRTEEVPAVPA